MREKLLDIIKHTSGLGFVESVRVTGSDTSTVFEAMDDERTIIIRAELKQPEPSLKGEFGMRNLGMLQGLLNHAPYKADGAKIDIKRKENAGVDAPEQFEFTAESGKDTAKFRFMSASLLPAQAQLKHNSWDITVDPTDSKIQEFSNLASIFGGVEQFFSVTTTDGDLQIQIGEAGGSNHSTSMTFAEGVSGNIRTTLYWPINQVLTVLKVGKGEKPQIQIMDLGALRINLETDHAKYSMIFPARKK
ncbi:hypothetical protein D3C87_583740 [compost metagenome]